MNEHWKACWESGQEALVVADVASQTDQVLLAVHQPPRLKEMPVPLPGRRSEVAAQAQDANQDELFERLMTPKPREHTLVIPIIGEPGTGKSHIIRWLRAAIPDRDDLVVRHIPREGTSLPQVVRILLHGLEGGRFDEVRQQMDVARNEITSLEEAANLLTLRIAGLVQFGIPSGWRRAAHISDELREGLCDASVLPALLTDHACRTHLTRVGGPVHRLAKDIVEGYRQPDEDHPDELGFRPEDLTFPNANLRGAGTAAKRAVSSLQMPGVAPAAAAILSDALDVAAKDVIGLSGVSLTDVFSELRAELMEQGRELVLLFEDMAIMRGLQLDLVDAITTPAVREGKQWLCTLRVALAITPSYWDEQAPETLATRVSSWGGRMFSLDVASTETDEVAATLIGRYLNAARVGVDKLGTRAASISTPTPNRCDDCPFGRRSECHSTFGVTSEGHGLFPLTTAAAKTAARLANRQTFRPRTVLAAVVGPVIGDRLRLEDGSFPSADGDIRQLVEGAVQRRALRDLPPSQLLALEQAGLSEADRARAQTVLRIWDVGASSSPETLLRALNLPNIATDGTPPPPTTRPPTGDIDSKPEVQVAEYAEELHAIEQWAGGSYELPAGVAQAVRRALFDELRAGVRWEEIGFSYEAVMTALGITSLTGQIANRTVRIERTSGGRTVAASARPLLVVKPSVANAQLLRGLFLRTKKASWGFSGGVDALARVRAVVRQAQLDFTARLATGSFHPKAVTDVAQILVLAATGLGIAEPRIDAPLEGSLAQPDSVPALSERSREWLSFTQAARRVHADSLEMIIGAAGRKQGRYRGDITAFDWTLVDAKRLTSSGDALLRAPRGEKAQSLFAPLIDSARAALAAEAAIVASLVKEIEDCIGTGEPLRLKTIQDEARESIKVAKAAQVLRPAGLEETLAGIRLPSSTDATALLEDSRSALRAARAGLSSKALAQVASLDLAALKRIAEYLETVDSFVTDSQAAARELVNQGPGEGNGPQSSAVREALRQSMQAVSELLSASTGGAS